MKYAGLKSVNRVLLLFCWVCGQDLALEYNWALVTCLGWGLTEFWASAFGVILMLDKGAEFRELVQERRRIKRIHLLVWSSWRVWCLCWIWCDDADAVYLFPVLNSVAYEVHENNDAGDAVGCCCPMVSMAGGWLFWH
ncbi:hypothetical protein Nepgr_021091 [Nepenthes gracilis]|uniref:Uncharacterized protein n=1 Tax=Nepenthes gracilis TaxID=150966 RepID=A0AAD3SWM2_NEPGR|nr:hypothetical protein Nepgr_021091 [Nepenthes gracilis]